MSRIEEVEVVIRDDSLRVLVDCAEAARSWPRATLSITPSPGRVSLPVDSPDPEP